MSQTHEFTDDTVFDGAHNVSLAWTPDGKQLASSGIDRDPTIRIWDSSTWKQVGEPWKGHTDVVWMIALNPTGTLLASASKDYQVRLWRLSDQRTIAIFKHTNPVYRVTFSTDGKHILSGGKHKMISKWAVPLPEDILQDHVSHASFVHFPFLLHLIFFKDVSQEDSPKEQVADNVGSHSWPVFLEKAFDTQTQSMSPNSTPFNIVDSLSRLAPTVY
jgi:WD40 repeat protein